MDRGGGQLQVRTRLSLSGTNSPPRPPLLSLSCCGSEECNDSCISFLCRMGSWAQGRMAGFPVNVVAPF